MSIHPFPHPVPAVPVEVYFQAAKPVVAPLRPLTALEQMYAYWGSDRA